MIADIYNESQIIIKDSYYFKDYIKQTICGAKWNPTLKSWVAEFSTKNIENLGKVGCTFSKEIDDKYKQKKQLEKNVLEEKMDEKSVEIEKMPIKVKPYQHQIKAFNIACKLMNLFK